MAVANRCARRKRGLSLNNHFLWASSLLSLLLAVPMPAPAQNLPPELLSLIFFSCDLDPLIASTQVCRSWNEEASRVLYGFDLYSGSEKASRRLLDDQALLQKVKPRLTSFHLSAQNACLLHGLPELFLNFRYLDMAIFQICLSICPEVAHSGTHLTT